MADRNSKENLFRKKAILTHKLIQARCKKRGIEFNLSVSWLEIRLKRGMCEVTKIPFAFGADFNGNALPWCPSVDRINPKKGYTVDNCRMVCLMFNFAKWSWSDEDVIRMARALVQNYSLLIALEDT